MEIMALAFPFVLVIAIVACVVWFACRRAVRAPIPIEQDTHYGTTVNAAEAQKCDHCGRKSKNFEHRHSGIRCMDCVRHA